MHGTLSEADHRHRPILTAVEFFCRLDNDTGIVLSVVTVTDREPLLTEGIDTVGSIGIEAILRAFVNAECSRILRASLLHGDQRECTISLATHGHLGAIGRDEQYGTAHLTLEGLHLPQLRLVRTVVLTYSNLITIGTKRLIAEGVDDTHTTRKVSYGPVLSFGSSIQLLELSLVAVKLECQTPVSCREKVVQRPLTESCLCHESTCHEKHRHKHQRADTEKISVFVHIAI